LTMGKQTPPVFGIELRANRGKSTKVHEDEPLILSVSIINEAAAQANVYNHPLKERFKTLERRLKAKHIDEEEFIMVAGEIREEMLQERIYRFGGPTGWTSYVRFQTLSDQVWEYVDWPLWVLVSYPSGLVAELDGQNSCYVEYGLDPEDDRRPNGETEIRAMVEIMKGEPSESNVVTVNFLKRKMSKTMRDKEETIQFLAEYSFKRELYDDARAHLLNILEANPSSIRSLALLGNIEEKKGDLSAALSTYVKTLEEFEKKYPDVDEPPDGLISDIERLLELVSE